jgi:formate hydrogenlyase subunit 3/multisubunit Na+/H+ antiporter MnhD subunit
VRQGYAWLALIMLALLAIIFVGMARMILDVAYGEPDTTDEPVRETAPLVAGPVALGLVVLLLGVHLPESLREALGQAARALGGRAP